MSSKQKTGGKEAGDSDDDPDDEGKKKGSVHDFLSVFSVPGPFGVPDGYVGAQRKGGEDDHDKIDQRPVRGDRARRTLPSAPEVDRDQVHGGIEQLKDRG